MEKVIDLDKKKKERQLNTVKRMFKKNTTERDKKVFHVIVISLVILATISTITIYKKTTNTNILASTETLKEPLHQGVYELLEPIKGLDQVLYNGMIKSTEADTLVLSKDGLPIYLTIDYNSSTTEYENKVIHIKPEKGNKVKLEITETKK